MKRYLLILLAAAAAACGKSARIAGTLSTGNERDTIYLQAVLPTGQTIVDSTVAKGGKFSFGVKLPQGEAIYNVRSKSYTIPLVLAPGERVRLSGMGHVARNYRVAGSPGSEQLRELVLILNNGAATLDSLNRIYMDLEPTDPAGGAIAQEYLKAFYSVKQDQIRFIVANSGSLAAVYGLYQRLPGDPVLFNNPDSDVVYYRLVADSLAARDSLSAYLPALRSDIDRMTPLEIVEAQVNYPDIRLPDMYGNQVTLSSLDGKVILVDFWTAASPQCRLLNAELKEFYSGLKEQGFEVYQVGVDADKALWVNTVQEQRLPWITLCDFRGENTPPLRAWNVTGLPANFLIDRQGNIVARNLYGEALTAKVKELLR